LAIGVPTVLISTLILLPIRPLRGFALAGLPHLLFLLLFVSRKSQNQYYFVPELMVYTCSLLVLFVILCRATVSKLWPRHRSLLVPCVSLFLGAGLIIGMLQQHASTITLKPRPDVFAIARSAGRQILGPNALVGDRLGRSYVNGGDLSYWVDPDLVFRNIGGMDLRKYFGHFDALALDPHMSDATLNEKNETLSSWYSERVLHLRGFFFSDMDLTYLLLNVNPSDRLQGYGLHSDGRLVRFLQQKDADWIFVAALCDSSGWKKVGLNPVFQSMYLLPQRGPVQQQLEILVVKNSNVQLERSAIANRCIIRDEVPVTMEVVDANQLLATLNHDGTIRFYETLEQAVEARKSELQGEISHSNGDPIH
jgi:hypothetical protein